MGIVTDVGHDWGEIIRYQIRMGKNVLQINDFNSECTEYGCYDYVWKQCYPEQRGVLQSDTPFITLVPVLLLYFPFQNLLEIF